MNKRAEEVIRLRKEGWLYQAIADRFGISRQRVHQIVKKNAPGIVVPKRPPVAVVKICEQCKNHYTVVGKGQAQKRRFCSNTCKGLAARKYVSVQARNMSKQERLKARYHSDPVYRAKINERNNAWAKKNPEKVKASAKRYQERRKKDEDTYEEDSEQRRHQEQQAYERHRDTENESRY